MIVRHRHPLEGRALELLGWMRRHGALELVLVLPDGSRSLIPAAWTDLDRAAGQEANPVEAQTLGGLGDLVAACALVAGLRRRVGTGTVEAEADRFDQEERHA